MLPRTTTVCRSARVVYIGLFLLSAVVVGWSLLSSRPLPHCASRPLSKKSRIVNYNASWCGHSNNLRPTWIKLQEALRDHPFLEVVDFRCDENPSNQQICNSKQIRGYPTIVRERSNGSVQEYFGDRSLQDLLKFANQR